MKRLFVLKLQNGQLLMEGDIPMYFNNKPDAKAARDHLNAGYKVSPGPDHHNYKGKR